LSVAAKLKAEREKFYDELLQKILALPSVQEYKGKQKQLLIEEWKEDTIPALKIGGETEYELEQSALADFFEGDLKDILAVEEIWNIVKEEIREEAEWRTSDAKTFWEDGLKFNAEDTMNKKLEEISDELDKALKRRHGK